MAHRLAWFFTFGDWPKNLACHKCDAPLCCRPSHLFNGTDQNNVDDREKKHRGVQRNNVKLTEAQVLAIHKEYAEGKTTHRKLASKYGVTHASVGYILRGKSWGKFMHNIEEALAKPGVVVDRWILRLGKNAEEAGKFAPWFLPSGTFKQDLDGFLACLNLIKVHEAVKGRMSTQAKTVRALRKQIAAELKEIVKMKAKVDKAEAKAKLKIERTAEKERIKTDAKRTREEAKLAGGQKGEELRPPTTKDMGKSVNEIPGKAEDTPATALVASTTAGLMECPAAFGYEEIPIERKLLVIPMEEK